MAIQHFMVCLCYPHFYSHILYCYAVSLINATNKCWDSDVWIVVRIMDDFVTQGTLSNIPFLFFFFVCHTGGSTGVTMYKTDSTTMIWTWMSIMPTLKTLKLKTICILNIDSCLQTVYLKSCNSHVSARKIRVCHCY